MTESMKALQAGVRSGASFHNTPNEAAMLRKVPSNGCLSGEDQLKQLRLSAFLLYAVTTGNASQFQQNSKNLLDMPAAT